jgi:hypothetical protein
MLQIDVHAPAWRSTPRRVWRWSRTSGTQPRLMIAVKAAGVGMIAWALAEHVPGVAAEYPYYAPLGVIVAMQSTVFAGLRSGLQTLIGIIVAGVTMWLGDPGVGAIAAVLGIGILISGFRLLGDGGTWAPTAALLCSSSGDPKLRDTPSATSCRWVSA